MTVHLWSIERAMLGLAAGDPAHHRDLPDAMSALLAAAAARH